MTACDVSALAPVRAVLADGTTVTLPKDCGCTDHAGPHWVYMDALAQRANAKLLDPVGKTPLQQVLGQAGFAIEEAARLEDKLRMMKLRKIVRLLPPSVG
ncbi:hypothetical protein E4T66_17475 [Sinimarinibacterium sp. CAU 1509]|uniref:hypothetical protein n=1 Tax=Sinimarinibacterium sp. CAU 1509 TaxID=2562283 RepID=UPI0010AB5B42|nr:hypothetical protein [Sinimarinibacterium sp. CAU 1509]TJY57200.1 hypothetical protein E4T66_17475 [Sinimarinibacterium sp. CAU 1509]